MVTTPTIREVATVYEGDPTTVGTGDLTNQEAEDLISSAVSMHTAIFSDSILFQGETLDGDEAVKYLSAHKWALALGDEVESEGQAGANASYNLPGGVERSLTRTKYGQEYLEYVRGEPNISVFPTR